jgi:carbon-monoxide dehydrogenase medium subunit
MKPAPFAYHRPQTLDDALGLLAVHGDRGDDVKALAGGQSLIPAMNFRLATPAVLVDLNRVSELVFIEPDGAAGVRIGAMTRQSAVESSARVAREAPLLHETMPFIAHRAIRNRGTIGGSLAHADPAAELPAVMLALDARVRARREGRDRWIAASDFFTGVFSTALEPGELLVEIVVPAAAGSGATTGCAFTEMSRRHGDFALAGVAASVALDANGQCTRARVALLSVSDRPVLAARSERLLVGERPTPDAIRAAAAASSGDIDPSSDIHASARYRRHLAVVLTRRALEQAFSRAAAESVESPGTTGSK